MHGIDAGFLLNEEGRTLGLDRSRLAKELALIENADVIDYAVRHRGLVFVQPAHHAVFVALCPALVAPLAALEAVHRVKAIDPECIVLSFPGESWKRARHELFSTKGGLEKMEGFARAARRRAAGQLRPLSRPPRMVIGRDWIGGHRRTSLQDTYNDPELIG